MHLCPSRIAGNKTYVQVFVVWLVMFVLLELNLVLKSARLTTHEDELLSLYKAGSRLVALLLDPSPDIGHLTPICSDSKFILNDFYFESDGKSTKWVCLKWSFSLAADQGYKTGVYFVHHSSLATNR